MTVIQGRSFTLADISKEVEPGGHYFGTSQTMEIFETAFYSPILSDWRNFETWEENGSVTATERANKVWKQLLENYEEPALDPSIAEELKAFIAQRKKEEKVDVS